MCPARHARLASAGSSCLTAARGPAQDPTRRLPWPPPPPQQPEAPWRGTRSQVPAPPLQWAPQRRRPRLWPGPEGSACHRQPPAGRPYFIELALRGLTQGWVHGAPQGLDNGVGVHRSADAVKPGARVLLGQE